jgi:hypothetical protein
MDKEMLRRAMRLMGAKGGKLAAQGMTKAQRIKRARKAAAASAKVRSAQAKRRNTGDRTWQSD